MVENQVLSFHYLTVNIYDPEQIIKGTRDNSNYHPNIKKDVNESAAIPIKSVASVPSCFTK